MRRLVFLALLGLPALASAAAPAHRYEVKQTLDRPYVAGASARQKLDAFAPKGADGERFPVVILLHGGTWMFGDKDFYGTYRDAAKNFARNGIVAVVPNYRLSPLVRHPEHAKDVARAFAWTVNNVDRYGGDPDRIILVGHSAGGHLAALVAADERYLKDPKLKLTDKQRQGLRGVVSLCGVYRVPREDEFKRMLVPIIRNIIGDSESSAVARTLQPLARAIGEGLNPFPWIFGRDAAVHKQASPVCNVHKGMPPHLLLTAEWEVPCLRDMAGEYESALKKCDCDVTYQNLDGCRHHSIIKCLHNNDTEASKLVLAFVKKHAGGPEKKSK